VQFIKDIFEKHGIKTTTSSTLSGGDINEVYKVKSEETDFVIKLNSASQYPNMFEKEAKSLGILAETNSFIIPETIAYGEFEDKTYLILSHIPSGQKTNFAQHFAQALAKLHRHQSENYGLGFDNYIGRLPQHNKSRTTNAVEFYINLRLEPQFKLAHQNGFQFKNIEGFYKNLEEIIPREKASLIHGDLWSGNYLISKTGKPCIYDPAIAFASREMDLAMMQLFGGYPKAIFEIYNDVFPLEGNWKSRIELWQLYYILVHVNLFGASYYGQAKHMIAKYCA
jgi:fructosamine-3-kinase